MIEGEHVFVTCLDGVSCCVNIADGTVVWKQDNKGTSAPLVVEGRVIFTEKERHGAEVFQRMRRAVRGTGAAFDHTAIYRRKAEYLTSERTGGSGLKGEHAEDLDKSVGFGAKPSSAKLTEAEAHVGVGSVASAWAYQGSRPAYASLPQFGGGMLMRIAAGLSLGSQSIATLEEAFNGLPGRVGSEPAFDCLELDSPPNEAGVSPPVEGTHVHPLAVDGHGSRLFHREQLFAIHVDSLH